MEPEQEKPRGQTTSRLVDAVRHVRVAAADKSDVVVEMREADRTRLELLAQELAPVIDDVSADDDRFDFAISSGLQPRFWIDVVAHVAMGRDRRTYRFVRDTRLGRVVLCESADRGVIADSVTAYIAERIHERELVLAGDVYSARDFVSVRTAGAVDAADSSSDVVQDSKAIAGDHEPEQFVHADSAEARSSRKLEAVVGGAVWILIGLLIGGGALLWIFRDTLYP